MFRPRAVTIAAFLAASTAIFSVYAGPQEKDKKEEPSGCMGHAKSASVAQEEGTRKSISPPESHCERPDPKDPKKGKKDPKKVGCKCVRHCENGKIREEPSGEGRCKNYCYYDRCSCPDPCKT